MNSKGKQFLKSMMDQFRQWQVDMPLVSAVVVATTALAGLVLLHRILGDSGAIRAIYLLPIWYATRLGGRLAGLFLVAITAWADVMVESQVTFTLRSADVFREGVLRFVTLAIVMLFIAHVESSLNQNRRMAMQDPLTGLLNRRALSEFARQVFGHARRKDEPLTVVMLDCDGFKSLNDSYGHKAGDHVLQILARILEYETRSEDLVARVGGDEFVVILQGADYPEALHTMERIERVFETAVRDSGYECSLSVGFAPMEEDSRTIEKLVEKADKAMYKRKEDKKAALYLT